MFTDMSHLLRDNPVQFSYGIAVFDVDGDGKDEFFVAGFAGYPNLALKWAGEGYRDMARNILADEGRHAIGLAAGDLDGDGREELYVLNTDTYVGAKRLGDRLFAFGTTGWIDLFEQAANVDVLNLTAGRSVACLDRNGNGRYGFFVANYGGPMRLYELDDDGILRDVAPQAGLALTTGGRSLLALPLLGTGMDIFAGNESGPNFFFHNQGDGTFIEMAAELGLDDPFEHTRGIAVLDGNDEGHFDLVYGNWEGPHRLFVHSSDGRWDDIAPPDMAAPSRVRTVIAADFDNDGYEEIFFNHIGQANRLFGRRGGEWVLLDIGDALEEDGLGTGAAVADLDGDGRLELLIAHGESGAQQLSLYQVAAQGNHYLRVRPLTRYGAPARGAIVSLEAGRRTQWRAIDAGSGYLCQMEPVAHFGLGTTTEVVRVTVRWPDGTSTTLEAPAIDQEIRVPYPA